MEVEDVTRHIQSRHPGNERLASEAQLVWLNPDRVGGVGYLSQLAISTEAVLRITPTNNQDAPIAEI